MVRLKYDQWRQHICLPLKSDAWGWELQHQHRLGISRIIFLFKIIHWIFNQKALFVAQPGQRGWKVIWSINYVTQWAGCGTHLYQNPIPSIWKVKGVCVCVCNYFIPIILMMTCSCIYLTYLNFFNSDLNFVTIIPWRLGVSPSLQSSCSFQCLWHYKFTLKWPASLGVKIVP